MDANKAIPSFPAILNRSTFSHQIPAEIMEIVHLFLFVLLVS
jgi:hypothetical protein